MFNTKPTKKTKEELCEIIDELHFHIIIISLCIDTLDALKEIGNERIKAKNAKNFFFIIHSSLMFRYEIELAKLVNRKEEMSIKKICKMCKDNRSYFGDVILTMKECNQMLRQLRKFKKTNKGLINRRNKALAHSDAEFYYYDKAYITKFSINYDDIKKECKKFYVFSKCLQNQIGSQGKDYLYPSHPDDVKRLFGLKTRVDLEVDEWIANQPNKNK